MAKRKAAAGGGLTFIGDGSSYVLGVPMRDLSADEVAGLTEAQRQAAEACGLYVAAAETPAPAKDEVEP